MPRGIGQFDSPHKVSVDSEGNVYSGEVDGNGNMQKLFRYGGIACRGTDYPKVSAYRTTS